ncbi:MAG: hypothetical protein WB809_06385 [Thermoplasmata archaeon]
MTGREKIRVDEQPAGAKERADASVDLPDLALFEPMQCQRRHHGIERAGGELGGPVPLSEVGENPGRSPLERTKGSFSYPKEDGVRVQCDHSTLREALEHPGRNRPRAGPKVQYLEAPLKPCP